MRQVEELWDDVVGHLVELIENGLRYEKNPTVILEIKEVLTTFVQTIEVSVSNLMCSLDSLLHLIQKTYEFNTASLQALLIEMFDKHSAFLEKEFGVTFEQVSRDFHLVLTAEPITFF